MVNIRRFYIYLVCAIALQSVAWAIIILLRNLVTPGREPVTSTAFQIAVIIIGLPLYLVHWLWSQRLVAGDLDERVNTLRSLYLYGMMAGFFVPFLSQAFYFVSNVLWRAFSGRLHVYSISSWDITSNLITIVILLLLWFYHQRILAADARIAPESGSVAVVRRLYVYGFSAVGLTLLTLAVIHLLRGFMFQLGAERVVSTIAPKVMSTELARLLVGLPVWLLFWKKAQTLFASADEAEGESALRKFYLYGIIFIAVLTTVTNATIILAGILRRLLGLPSSDSGDIRVPLAIILVMPVLWAYHAYVLRKDAAVVVDVPRQAGIRRLYLYLVAGIGLAAVLVGLAGDISTLIRQLSEVSFGFGLKNQLAYFTAALLAGLPVWLLPWRQLQILATEITPLGTEERRSVVRKIYLYFYLFLATMTVLSSAVYILYRLLSLLLGAARSGNLASDLGQAIAFTLIGVGVWLYHGSALRSDGRLNVQERLASQGAQRVVVVDHRDGTFGRALMELLRREVPGVAITPIGLTAEAAAAVGMGHPTEGQSQTITERLATAGLIVGSWEIAVAGGAGGMITQEIAAAVASSPALKLIVPLRAEGWEWAGVERWGEENLLRQTVHAIQQILDGKEVKPVRPMGAGAIIGIIIAVIILLLLVAIPLISFFGGF